LGINNQLRAPPHVAKKTIKYISNTPLAIVMGQPEIVPTEGSNDIIESDEKLSQEIPDANADLPPVTPTRSYRPTFAKIDTSELDKPRKSSDLGFEPAQKEKWTVKRVIKVTWAYVTTVKASSINGILSLTLSRDF
jgi:hypothetical protein